MSTSCCFQRSWWAATGEELFEVFACTGAKPFSVFAYLWLSAAGTQGSWVQCICLLVNIFGKREEADSHMNTEKLTKVLSFCFWKFYVSFLCQEMSSTSLSHWACPPGREKGQMGHYVAQIRRALQSSRRIRHIHSLATHVEGTDPGQTH